MDGIFEIECESDDGTTFLIHDFGDGRPVVGICQPGGRYPNFVVTENDLPRLIEALQSCVRAAQVEEAA